MNDLIRHPIPANYHRVDDGDMIEAGDLALGKVLSVCGQVSYGWRPVPAYLIGQEFFENAIELGHPSALIRKSTPEFQR